MTKTALNRKARLAGAMLLLLSFATGTGSYGQSAATSARPSVKAEKYLRTELYFGRSIPGGGSVSDEDWSTFLADVVTPRFPAGFTVLSAIGQYRESSGTIAREQSQVLIFLYTAAAAKQSRANIEEIRAAYMSRFRQESVMRVDLSRSVRVRF